MSREVSGSRGPLSGRYDHAARAEAIREPLLPCPFCGAPARWIDRRENTIAIVCGGDDCEVAPDTMGLLDARLALRAWNTRPKLALDAAGKKPRMR